MPDQQPRGPRPVRVLYDEWDFTEPLTPGQVARLFSVDPKTVARWSRSGKLAFIQTPGGHRRYSREQVTKLAGGTGIVEAGS